MTRKLRTILVDDERLARADLKRLLAKHPEIEVIGEADSVAAAIRLIARENPDLLFLDIQMPGGSGFDLLEKIDLHAQVVFVTAFDEYAIRAFDVEATGYLLKPVLPDRLAAAVERVCRREPDTAGSTAALRIDDAMLLPLNNHLKVVRISTIVAIHAAGDYSELTTSDGRRGLVLKTMGEWEQRLPAAYFRRIHRSTIVNLEQVRSMEELPNGSWRVHLNGVAEPEVMSRRYASVLRRTMK